MRSPSCTPRTSLTERCLPVIVTPKGTAKLLDVGMTEWTLVNDDERIDDFAGLGSVVFETLTGRPIRRGWPAELKLPAIPEPVRPVLRRLLSTNPGEQYDSMALVSAALRDALLRLTASVETPAPTASPGRPSRSSAVLALFGVMVVLAALVWFAMSGR